MRQIIENGYLLQLNKPSPQADLSEGESYGAIETESGGWVRVSGREGKSVLAQASLFTIVHTRSCDNEPEEDSAEEMAEEMARNMGIL